jgi:succinate dehydrogenase / fumarate reductase, cytochrome b subunit
MAEANRGNRPLSPHLQIYRWQITSTLSILNRITGAGLALTAMLIVWWFVAAASSPDYFALVDGILTSWFGLLVMTASVWALWYHTLNGIRHLVWDTGRGFDLKLVTQSGWAVVAGSVVLTILTLVIAGGGA